MQINAEHRLSEATWLASSHGAPRAKFATPELVVIHCVSLPEGQYGTGAAARLFTGQLDVAEHPSFADLEGVRVAPHVLIDRAGHVLQFIGFDQQAWHAGLSIWRGRPSANGYAIGIELEGTVDDIYTEPQYAALHQVLLALLARYPGLSATQIVGHNEIAPDRKDDPGPHFDWHRLLSALGTSA